MTLLRAILDHYVLDPDDIHGVPHWARVCENGRRIAATNGGDPAVVELFALFHDACRVNNGRDPDHGSRGAALAATMRGRFFEVTDRQFTLLEAACRDHTRGYTEAHPTVQACWDADRLDLPRVGTWVVPERLCTHAARDPETIRWGARRAKAGTVPALLSDEWGW